MSLTLAEWAKDEGRRKILKEILEHPVLKDALDTIRDDNLPSLQLTVLPPGMDAAFAYSVESAKRGGVQEAISKLRAIPNLSNERFDAIKKLGAPFSHVEREMAAKESEEQEKPKKKKS